MADNTDSGWRELFIKGGWIPPSREALEKWITTPTHEPKFPKDPYLHPAVQELKHLIDNDPEVYMGFHDMLAQKGPISDTKSLLDMLSDAIRKPPGWSEDARPGLTINHIVSSIVITDFGFATFLNPKVNAAFKKILNAWTRYLATPDSTRALTSREWLSEDAMSKLSTYLPPGGTPTEQFKTAFVRRSNYADETWGFQSWDSFFTRRFVDIDKTRPLPADDNPDVIVSACESTIYNIQRNATETGKFWLKGMEYSLRIMLNDDEFAPLFYGGTVYQAFLDVWDYHRWHSPVNGTVKKVVNVPGTYYALPPAFYKDLDLDKEAQGISEAQTYLAVAATRALIFIESDNPDIGLLCFIAVGMGEVSSCEITVRAGDRVKKGDQIGSFHFGGSTSCLVFQDGLDFVLDPKWHAPPEFPPKEVSHVPLRARLGTLKKRNGTLKKKLTVV